MAVSAPSGLPGNAQAFGWAGVVAPHDLIAAASHVIYTANLQINYANVSRYSDYPTLPVQNANGRARISIDVRHQHDPDCRGYVSTSILDYGESLINYPEEPLVLSVGLEGCGERINPGRITIDVQATADAYIGNDLIGDSGSIQTVLDFDVRSFVVDES